MKERKGRADLKKLKACLREYAEANHKGDWWMLIAHVELVGGGTTPVVIRRDRPYQPSDMDDANERDG